MKKNKKIKIKEYDDCDIAVEKPSILPYVVHVSCDGKRKHGLYYDKEGRHCRFDMCIINNQKDKEKIKTEFVIFESINQQM